MQKPIVNSNRALNNWPSEEQECDFRAVAFPQSGGQERKGLNYLSIGYFLAFNKVIQSASECLGIRMISLTLHFGIFTVISLGKKISVIN